MESDADGEICRPLLSPPLLFCGCGRCAGENVLIGNDRSAKLSDFGCVARLDSEGLAGGGLVGSLPWCAPEVFSGVYGPKVDLWSLGCTLVEAVCVCGCVCELCFVCGCVGVCT